MIPKSPPLSTTSAQACSSSAHHPPTAPETQPGDCLSPAATGPAASVASGARQDQQDLAALLTLGLVDIKRSMAGMETRIKDQISGLEQAVNKNKQSIVTVTDILNKHTVDLARFESQLRSSNDAFERRVTDIVRSVVGTQDSTFSSTEAGSVALGRRQGAPTPEQEARYWKCRRSLRLWPLTGLDLRDAAQVFIQDLLGLDGLEVVAARKIVEPRSKVQDEAVVEFTSPAVRDAVKSSGFKLEGKKAGIRMEVPNYLRSDFHLLQNTAFKLKLSLIHI